MSTNELSTQVNTNQVSIAEDMAQANQFYYTGSLETKDDKKAFFNAIQNPDEQLRDHINKKIDLVNVYIAPVLLESSEEPGVKVQCPRIVLFGADGTSYTCVSVGVYNSLKTLFQTFGDPGEWDEPITVEVKQVSRGTNQLLTLKVC